MFQIESCAKQQVQIDDLSEKGASAQVQIEQCSDLRWRRAKAWNRCLAWFWIDCNQSLQSNRSQIKCYVWKPCSDQRWQDELLFSIWRFFEQFVFVNNHLLYYWPIIHNSILKICPKFQVLSSHFLRMMSSTGAAWWAMSKNCAKWNISTPIYVECDKMYLSKALFKNSGIACLAALALIFNLSYPRLTNLHAKKLLQVANNFK